MARVLEGGPSPEAFPVTGGVKHCSVLAPTLFSVMLIAMLRVMPFRTVVMEPAVRLAIREAPRPEETSSCCQNEGNSSRCFSFARDRPLKVSSEPERQVSVDKFPLACDNFGLTVNLPRTGAMGQSGPHAPDTEPKVTIKGQKLQPLTTSISPAAPVLSSDRWD